MFIKQLSFEKVDLTQIRKDMNAILDLEGWGYENQLGLTYRPNAENKWKDSTGSLYDRERKVELIKETDFTEFNEDTPDYLKTVVKDFAKFQGIEIGRARLMRLEPKKGLTVHHDNSVRYHLVVTSNQHSFICHTVLPNSNKLTSLCYTLPADGFFYTIDTTKEHFVYNGGTTDRIHLVISPKE